ncbi:MAG TPA: DUF4919 domain-containing protein [Stellaceae bacterium]|nr:DUF4919 domain-containing protein [Stellaceae bacterium]
MTGGRAIVPILAGVFLALITAPALAADDSEPKYEALVQRLKAGDLDVDFEALRMAYTRSDYYLATDDADLAELRGAMFQALSVGDLATAGERAQRILDLVYVDIDAHLVMGIVDRRTNDDAKAEFHRAIAMGLLESIRDSGDGKSTDTAFVVISSDEEFALLRSQGLQPKGRSMIRGDGKAFDVIDAADDAGHKGRLYFNVSIPLGQATPEAKQPSNN